jgi:hypothetical protein
VTYERDVRPARCQARSGRTAKCQIAITSLLATPREPIG